MMTATGRRYAEASVVHPKPPTSAKNKSATLQSSRLNRRRFLKTAASSSIGELESFILSFNSTHLSNKKISTPV
ncbi:hypothetical protein ACLB2K_073368 [Fragaria x ananassa]